MRECSGQFPLTRSLQFERSPCQKFHGLRGKYICFTKTCKNPLTRVSAMAHWWLVVDVEYFAEHLNEGELSAARVRITDGLSTISSCHIRMPIQHYSPQPQPMTLDDGAISCPNKERSFGIPAFGKVNPGNR